MNCINPETTSEIAQEILQEAFNRRITGGEILLLMEEASLGDLIANAKILRRENRDLSQHQKNKVTPDNVYNMAEEKVITTFEMLKTLKSDGLNELSGNDAIVLSDRIRSELSVSKLKAREWIEICEEAGFLGIKTKASMTIGSAETYVERVEHLLRLRESQDKAKIYIGIDLINSSNDIDFERMGCVVKIALDNFAF